MEAAYDRAWCAGDIEALMECFSRDAVVVNPRGEVAVGEDAIRQVVGSFLRREAAGSRHESQLERVSFVGDDVAVVDGWVEIAGGSLGSPIQHRFTDILVRERRRWLLLHVRAYALHGG